MFNEPLLDIAIDASGEIAVGYNGDLLVARDEDVVLQEILFRLKTYQGDWSLEPECGASLEDLIGEPSGPATWNRLQNQIYQALTHDGFLTGAIEAIEVLPVNRNQLLATLIIRYGDELLSYDIALDLREGIL